MLDLLNGADFLGKPQIDVLHGNDAADVGFFYGNPVFHSGCFCRSWTDKEDADVFRL